MPLIYICIATERTIQAVYVFICGQVTQSHVDQRTRFLTLSVRLWSSLFSSYRGSGSWALASAELTQPHTPMAKVVSLQQIPTLRELYRRSAIAALSGTDAETRFPFSSTLLDRVSV